MRLMNRTFLFLLLILSFAIPDLNGPFDSFIQNNSADDKIELASDSYHQSSYRIYKETKVVKERHSDCKVVTGSRPDQTEGKFHYSNVTYRHLRKIYAYNHRADYPLII